VQLRFCESRQILPELRGKEAGICAALPL